VITTTAISWRRRRSWHEKPAETVPESPVHPAVDGYATRAWVWTALQQLPPRQRAAVVLRYYEDLTEAQTAAVMGCAVGTVKSQVAQGLKKLREQLGPDAAALALDEVVGTR
jgi:RNA polymerase sigma factor (sigma-70 family)